MKTLYEIFADSLTDADSIPEKAELERIDAEESLRTFMERYVTDAKDMPKHHTDFLDEFLDAERPEIKTVHLPELLDFQMTERLMLFRDIPFSSISNFSMMPYTGTVTLAIIPSDKIIDRNCARNYVQFLGRSIMHQTELTQTIADGIVNELNAEGAMVVMDGNHVGIDGEPTKVTTTGINGVVTRDVQDGSYKFYHKLKDIIHGE